MKQDKAIRVLLMLVALSAIAGLALITIFIFKEGVPFIFRTGVREFFLSSNWAPTVTESNPVPHFGIFSMIVGSLAVTAGAMVVGVTLSLACAIVLTQFCPKRLAAVIKPCIEILAGIPSVVYGFMGMVTLVPFAGYSVLSASIVLGIMALPTITSISVDALQAVPRSYWEGSIALGATRWQTTTLVMLRAARSGIVAAIILGMGRAIGETMAVIMVAGNALRIPHGLFDSVRTLTAGIAQEIPHASGEHAEALFASGVTLFVIIMILNGIALAVSRRRARSAGK